jgi:hypothetical protein
MPIGSWTIKFNQIYGTFSFLENGRDGGIFVLDVLLPIPEEERQRLKENFRAFRPKPS